MSTVARMMLCVSAMALLAGCSSMLSENPTLTPQTQTSIALNHLPPPSEKLYAAVFSFQDESGQHKPNTSFAEYSLAVTQGGASILVDALTEAGDRQWFTVVERTRLPDLLQERQLIRANRIDHVGPDGKPLPGLPALHNAGLIMEGGIIGYDADTLTGGLGARYLGIGADANYRRDTVSVYLRAVSVTTGDVLVSVTTSKTIYSAGIQGSIYKFVSFQKLLEAEAGITSNEPVHLAIRQAVEKAVNAVIVEGAAHGYWAFADRASQDIIIRNYLMEKNGVYPVDAISQQSFLKDRPEVVKDKVAGK